MTLRALFPRRLKDMLLIVCIRLTAPPKMTFWASGQRPMILPIRTTALVMGYSPLEEVRCCAAPCDSPGGWDSAYIPAVLTRVVWAEAVVWR